MSTRADQGIPSGSAGFAAAAMIDRTVTHMIERLRDVRVEAFPFQHFYVEGIFPDDVYQQISENFPDKSSYLPINIKRWKNAVGESTRDRLCLSEGELDRIDDARRSFWTALTRALESDALRRAVYDKLGADRKSTRLNSSH